MKKIKAFTLIELLVVVAIIGILAAVGVTAFSGFQEKAKISATKANHKTVVKYFANIITLCSLGRSENGVIEYWSYPQCKLGKTHCNEQTDVAWFQVAFSNKFACQYKNAYNGNEPFAYSYPQRSNSPTPSVVGRMHISTAWPKENTVTIKTKWGNGTNEIMSDTILQN